MKFNALPLPGAFEIEFEPVKDHRGFFARTWSEEEFSALGLETRIAQCGISFNPRQGTLRGLHYQIPPYAEVKLVRCTRGRIFDVLLDLRQDSPTYTQWVGRELASTEGKMLYVPEGLAHGFLTLENDSEIFYQTSQPYRPEWERGVRWDDPRFKITWPELDELVLSEKDRNYPDFVS